MRFGPSYIIVIHARLNVRTAKVWATKMSEDRKEPA